MDSNEYHFVTTWRVQAALSEVNDIIDKASDLPRCGWRFIWKSWNLKKAAGES